MEDMDVWRCAHHYTKRYGDGAVAAAARRADALLAKGDAEGARLWQRVVAAINELEREKPNLSLSPP
jgi:hypothetical protein